MVKHLDANGAAKQVIEAGRPAVEFRITSADLKQPAPPRQNPKPAPVGKLGQGR
jgi:hypothetical protein